MSELPFDDRDVEIERYEFREPRRYSFAADRREFVQAVGAGLIIVISGEWTGLLFGLAGGGMGGAAFALFVRRTQAIFHRGTGQVTIRTRSVFGFSENTHPLSEVERAEVESSRNSDGQFTHRPVLIMLGEARVPVMDVYSSGGGATRLVAAINDWLGEGRTGTAAAE